MLQKAPDVAQVLAKETERGRHRRRRRWIVAALVVLAAAGLAAWWYAGASARGAQRYVTEAAKLADIEVTVVATGTLEPVDTADVSTTIAGTVVSVTAQANDQVRKDQALAKLDMGDLDARLSGAQAAVSSQEANVLVAQTNLADAQTALKRAEALAAGKTLATRDLELAQSAVKRAQAQADLAAAQLKVAEADLQGAQNDHAKACICAPIDGVVLEDNVDVGQTITAAAGLAKPLFSLASDLKHLHLKVDIDEADIGSVQEGDQASFVVEAWPERTFAGVIGQIRYAPNIVDGVVSYQALLDVDNADMALRPGMTTTANITVASAKGVLSVPDAALRFSPQTAPRPPGFEGLMPSSSVVTRTGHDRTVWVLRGATLTEVAVTTGLDDGTRSQITGGTLAAGDLVVTGTTAVK